MSPCNFPIFQKFCGLCHRVLPCQHTYHLGCLQLTLAREGELRCPECRRLSDVHLENLLPNYTLNKILESLPLEEQNSQSDHKRLVKLFVTFPRHVWSFRLSMCSAQIRSYQLAVNLLLLHWKFTITLEDANCFILIWFSNWMPMNQNIVFIHLLSQKLLCEQLANKR